MQIYRIVTKHWNLFDKLQKRPVRFLVALNTLDKFLGRHAQVEDVTIRFGSVMCSLQISYMNVLYRLNVTHALFRSSVFTTLFDVRQRMNN